MKYVGSDECKMEYLRFYSHVKEQGSMRKTLEVHRVSAKMFMATKFTKRMVV